MSSKHVSKSSGTPFSILDRRTLDIDAMDFGPLIEGTLFLKFGKRGHPHETYLNLSEDRKYVQWTSTWKKPEVCRVYLDEIKFIRKGFSNEKHKRWLGSTNFLSFHIIFGTNEESRILELCAHSKDVYNTWWNGVNSLVDKIREDNEFIDIDKRYLKAKWDIADADHYGNLTCKEVSNLVASLCFEHPSRTISKFFHRINVDQSGLINFQEFCLLMDALRKRPELEHIWGMLMSGNNIGDEIGPFDIRLDEHDDSSDAELRATSISISTFIAFWQLLQYDRLTPAQALAMINDIIPNAANSTNDFTSVSVSYHVWNNMISQRSNDAFDTLKLGRYQDMTHPLSHYFIASSHNTYLEGDQLTSKCSVNRYMDVLCKGCRCIELDCWDGDNGEPTVYYSNANGPKLLLFDVAVTIKTYAFKSSPYPLIIRLENNCSYEQQGRIAEIFHATFGKMMLSPHDFLAEDEMPGDLPSPEELKYRIILEGVSKDSNSTDEIEDEDIDPEDDDGDSDGIVDDMISEDDNESSGSQHDGGEPGPGKGQGKAGKASKYVHRIHPALSEIIYLSRYKLSNFIESSLTRCDRSTKILEPTLTTWLKSDAAILGLIIHNNQHMSYAIPKKARVDSSNLDPASAWATGCQLVALNYQTPGFSMQLNDGKFRENGNCGYVLKPAYMVSNGLAMPEPGVRMLVHMLSGHQLPKLRLDEILDPFVLVTLSGLPSDVAEYRTKTILNNGFNPVWNEVYSFDIHRPEVAQITFRVYDDVLGGNNRFLAYTSIPISCIRRGLRCLTLFDEKGFQKGEFTYARLCVRIDFVPL